MPAPSKWNRQAKARNDARKARARGGRTPSEAGLGRSMAASGRAVSRTNTRVPKANRVRAVRSPLALPEVQTSIERLRQKYGSETLDRGNREARQVNTEVSQDRDRAERKLENAALRSMPTRGEALKAAPAVRQSTQLNAEGTRVERLAGATQVGNEPLRAVMGAAKRGRIKRRGKQFTTPKVRRTERKVRRARRELRKARNATRTPRKNLMRAGLDAEQAKVLSTVLRIGRRQGASKKEMLAAVETALVESGIRNLGYGDADSSGWRQERAMYYPNPQNVKASAGRFFQETAAQGRGAGMTAGQLAQAVQRSAFPDKYDERKGDAVPLLRAFNSAGNASPKARARLARAEARANRAGRQAAKLGIGGTKGGKSEDRYKGPLPDSNLAYPLSARGPLIATPADHANRAFGNWQSDNAVDIEVPVGTPVKAVADGVISRVSGSAPNHSANPAGWNVYLKDKSGEEYFYAHLENYSVKQGQRVRAGQVIGESGAANSVPHLHLARRNGDPVETVSGGSSKSDKPRFINFSKKGGVGTSQTKWLVPTGGNEVLKFQRPLARALVNLARASGEPIRINSGFRSRAEQEALYQAHLNGTGNLAAPPGSSNHEFGAAADVELTPRQRELAPQFGLGFPVAGEDWHIELVGDAANRIVSGGGGSSGYGGTAPASGGTSAPAASGSGTDEPGPTPRQLLRRLGYKVTSKGIERTGLAAGISGEGGEEKTLSTAEMKRRYGIK